MTRKEQEARRKCLLRRKREADRWRRDTRTRKRTVETWSQGGGGTMRLNRDFLRHLPF